MTTADPLLNPTVPATNPVPTTDPTVTPNTSLGSTSTPATTTPLNNYLDNYQGSLMSMIADTSAPAVKTTYTPDELAAALVSKGGYNQTDAMNAAQNKGGRADELAKEFLGVGKDTSTPMPTFSDIKSQLTPTTAMPAPINRVDNFNTLRANMGVNDLEAQLNLLKADQRTVDAQLRANKTSERGKVVAQNVIEGRISKETQQAQEQYDFVGRQIASITDQLNTAYNVINMTMNFQNLDYQDAVTAYNTEFSQNLQVIDLMRGLKKDAITEQQRQIDNARANLTVFTNAITNGNMSYDQLSSDQKATINKLETQAGLPIGFTSSLGLSAKDKVLFQNTNNGVTQVGIMDASGNVTVKSYGTKTSGGTVAAKEKSAVSAMQTKLIELGGSDNLVSPAEWKQQRNIWQQAGYDVNKFDSAFKDTFVDWSHPTDYGLLVEDKYKSTLNNNGVKL